MALHCFGCCRRDSSSEDTQNLIDSSSTPIDDLPAKRASLWQYLRFAKWVDVMLISFGVLAALGSGLPYPFMSVVLGEISEGFLQYDLVRKNSTITPEELEHAREIFNSMIVTACWKFVIIGCFWAVTAFFQVSFLMLAAERMCQNIRLRFIQAVLHHEIEWFDRNSSGTLCTQLFDALERVKDAFGLKLGKFLYNASVCVTGISVGFYYSWKLACVMLCITPFLAGAGIAYNQIVAQTAADALKRYSKAGKIAEEALSAVRTVLTFNGQKHEVAKYANALNEGTKKDLKRSIYTALGQSLTYCMFDLMYCVAFYIGTDYVYWGMMSPKVMITVVMAIKFGSFSLGMALPDIALISSALGQAGALMEVIDSVDLKDKKGAAKLSHIDGKVTVDNIHFTYPSRPDVPILKGVSFDCEPGETIALVGSSGSGKSTIVQLLLRYYELHLGNITIDGVRLDEFDVDYLRQIVGVVSQEPVLFNTTILENLRFGNPNANEKMITAALKKANALNFVSEFPDGLNTLVGDRGTQMSGGQKQRIAIARALLRDPKILLLDEATSALDADSEMVVQKALENASKGRTTIVIAHRLSTIKNAHKIVVIKNGEVVESGQHADLMEAKSHYYELVNAQVFTDMETHPEAKPGYLRQRSTRMSTGSDSTLEDPEHKITSIMPTTEKDLSEIDRLKQELKEEGLKKSSLFKILPHVGKDWKYLAMGLTMSSLEGVLYPLFGLFYTKAFEAFSNSDREALRHAGHMAAFSFLICTVADAIIPAASLYSFGVTSLRVLERLRAKTFANVLRQDGEYFDSSKHSAGKIATRLATDAPNIKDAVDSRLGNVLRGFVAMACALSVGFYFSWQMTLLMFIVVPVISMIEWVYESLFDHVSFEDLKLMEASGKVAIEAVENIRTVHALSLEDKILEKYAELIERPFRTNKRKALVQGVLTSFMNSFQPFMDAVEFRFSAWMITKQYITNPFDAWRAQFALEFSSVAVGQAVAYLPDYKKATYSAGLFFNMMNQEPKIDSTETKKARIQNSQVEFKNVRFSYPERSDVEVLKGISFTLEPGQTVAVVGPSGCGKSTLVGLLQRFYDVNDGSIIIDGTDVRSWGAADIRASMAVVSQEPVLFDDTIYNNIIYGVDFDVSEEAVFDAARKANIHSFVASLPLGYNTTVGEKGAQLSGGQKQRVAIARALIRNPKILILDEATSALDTESEKVVQEALNAASIGRTCLVIAHRLSTIRDAHKIVVLRAGEVVEQGNHAELMAKKEAYFKLVLQQERRTQQDTIGEEL